MPTLASRGVAAQVKITHELGVGFDFFLAQCLGTMLLDQRRKVDWLLPDFGGKRNAAPFAVPTIPV